MPNIGVFVSHGTNTLFHSHFTKCDVINSITVYNDIDLLNASKHSHKLACLQMPYPYNSQFQTLVSDVLDKVDNVLILVSELHDNTVDFIKNNDSKQISYFICGELNFELLHSPVHKFYDWFDTTIYFYKHNKPELLNQLTPYVPKAKYFDALLGRKKVHRDIAYFRLDQDKNIVTYINSTNVTFDNWRWETEGVVCDTPINWTVDRITYYGFDMSLSQVMPLEVYAESAYSLIAETNYSNHYSFYTEKTIKPILGRRLFVMLSGQYALKNLRDIGFKTFDSVIDESYDTIENLSTRCNAALDQIDFLNSQPQEEILSKIMPICDHNFNHAMGIDWYNDYFKKSFIEYFYKT